MPSTPPPAPVLTPRPILPSARPPIQSTHTLIPRVQLPFLLKVSLFERASVPLAPPFLGRSARHLFLTDVDPPVESPDVGTHIDSTPSPRIFAVLTSHPIHHSTHPSLIPRVQLPFLLKVSLFERASVPLAPLFLGRSARHLFLTDVDPPVETPDFAPPNGIEAADANPRIGSNASEPQIETVGAANTQIDTTSNADLQPDTAGVDALGDAVAGKTQAAAVNGNPCMSRVDLSTAASGIDPPLSTDTTLPSSVDAGRPLADLSANAAAEALASVKGAARKQHQKQQQQHGMVRLHRLGSSLIDVTRVTGVTRATGVTRVTGAEGRSEETTEKGVGSHKEKHQLPLLLRMTTDNEEGPFLSALAAFKYRAAYANVSGDQYSFGILKNTLHQWEMPSPDELHELPDYRFIVRVQPMPCESDTSAVQAEPREPEASAPGCHDTGARGEEKGCYGNTPSLHLVACDASRASAASAAAAAAAAAAARADTTGASATEASDVIAGNATGNASGGPSGAPSGGPSDGSAGDAPEPKEHTNFFARLKGRWKVGGKTAATPGFGLGFGFGSPQQQLLPFKQQPLKLKEKGHTKQGEEGEEEFENPKISPDDPPEGSPEEGEGGRLQLVRSMSEGMVPRGASGRGSGGGGSGGSGSGGSSGEGSGNSRTGQGAMKTDKGHERVPLTPLLSPPPTTDAMVDNLNRVPWARIDVNFASSPLAFLAHILIQVNIPTLKAHGASVIQHVIDNFVV
ncbi:unnamed protein product [Closterium sp. Yama58-4]|nr:unnamed protein product [Closterium sp. Yama58-4]